MSKHQCCIAFETICNSLGDSNSNVFKHDSNSSPAKAPLFVTWKTQTSSYDPKRKASPDSEDEVEDLMWELRGCIGSLSPLDLSTAVSRYAKEAAFRDPRFPPIKKSELKKLKCDVSILTDFEEAKDARDWVVGTHGILLSYTNPAGKKFSATFLPSVAKECGWDQDTTLEHLLRKAGVRASVKDVFEKLSVVRYQSTKASLSWNEYMDMRNSAASVA